MNWLEELLRRGRESPSEIYQGHPVYTDNPLGKLGPIDRLEGSPAPYSGSGMLRSDIDRYRSNTSMEKALPKGDFDLSNLPPDAAQYLQTIFKRIPQPVLRAMLQQRLDTRNNNTMFNNLLRQSRASGTLPQRMGLPDEMWDRTPGSYLKQVM